MVVLFLILVICVLIGVKIDRFHTDYCGRGQSVAIKGIFAVIILFSHMNSYLSLHSAVDILYSDILNLIGQLMVTMFFFYSGFGISEGWKNKPQYSVGFLKKRFLKVLVHFDVAVLLFVLLNAVLRIPFSEKDYLLCWIGWTSIGNSNWFIFDTLVMYILSFAAMRICERRKWNLVVLCGLVSALSIALWLVLYKVKGYEQSWWFNTVFCFPAGFWYSLMKDPIDAQAKNPILWWIGLLGLGACFGILYIKCRWNMLFYSVCTAVFCVLLVWITMKVKICNRLLLWLGENSFAIYILQRIPMALLEYFGANKYPYLFAALVMVMVFPLSGCYTWLMKQVDNICFFWQAGVSRKGEMIYNEDQ